MVKNEITAHAVAAITLLPEVRTVFEIGGQDSKLIIIRDRYGRLCYEHYLCRRTGFFGHQAVRLGHPIENLVN